jgi:hypothetical protein
MTSSDETAKKAKKDFLEIMLRAFPELKSFQSWFDVHIDEAQKPLLEEIEKQKAEIETLLKSHQAMKESCGLLRERIADLENDYEKTEPEDKEIIS